MAAIACAGVAGAQSGSLEAGIAAYRAGDYGEARDQFLQAQKGGDSGAELSFNLALSYYKLGDYPAARSQFAALRGNPDFAAAAEYHLGLVAARQGLRDEAATHLRASEALTDSADLRQLAGVALERLGFAPPPARAGAARVTLGGGYDSNRAQASEELVERTQLEPAAAFAELAANGRWPLAARSDLQGRVYVRDYAPDRDLDQHAAQLLLRQTWPAGAWEFGTAVEAEAVWLGGDAFQDAAGLNLDATWSGGASSVSARYRPSVVAGGNDFEYVDGSCHRAELAYAWAPARYRLRLAYEAEFNDRRDLIVGDEFFSQSPDRNGLALRFSHRPAPALSLDWSARYRHSRYRDPSRIRETTGLVVQRRVDDLAQVGVAANLKVGTDWGLRLDYRYSDNASSIDRYAYDRHAVLLALEWSR